MQEKIVGSKQEAPVHIQQHLDIMSYFLGWTEISYAGPHASTPFINRAPYINLRTLKEEVVNEIQQDLIIRKYDFRFPIDLLVAVGDIPTALLEQIKVDGSQPNAILPVFELLGRTQEEANLMSEIWFQHSITQHHRQLTSEECSMKASQLYKLFSAERPMARILAGRHRDEAMQQIGKIAHSNQEKLNKLLQTNRVDIDVEEIAHLAEEQKWLVKRCKFRARLFDGEGAMVTNHSQLIPVPARMPMELQTHLAKNEKRLSQQGPTLGEEIYMFQIQTHQALLLLRDHYPLATHPYLMNEWHKQYVNHQQARSMLIGNSSSKEHGTVNKSTSACLALIDNNPMCVEMLISAGLTMVPFENLTATTLQALASDDGGWLLATLWLDILTLHKICAFQSSSEVFAQALTFLQKFNANNLGNGNTDAVDIWTGLKGSNSPVVTSIGIPVEKILKQYSHKWEGQFIVEPGKDHTHGAIEWDQSQNIQKKRKIFWETGLWCETQGPDLCHKAGTMMRLYALLPTHSSGMVASNCFYPAADLPVRKKISQVERQSKYALKGAGSVLAISILGSQKLWQGYATANKHFPGFSIRGKGLRKLIHSCSTKRSGPFKFEVLGSLISKTNCEDETTLQTAFKTAVADLAVYGGSKDITGLPELLERNPVLIQLLGDQFFNRFELLRYLHGGPAAATATSYHTKPLQVTQAAVGMGLLIKCLEDQVLLPLMTDHWEARYILHAAAQVEMYAPNLIDDEQESTWWSSHIPWKLQPDAHPGLVKTAELDKTLPEDVTMPQTQGASHDQITLTVIPELERVPSPFPVSYNTMKLMLHEADELPEGLQLPTQDSGVLNSSTTYECNSFVPDCSGDPLHTDFIPWDKLLTQLPESVTCPNQPSKMLVHHIQGIVLPRMKDPNHITPILHHINQATCCIHLLLERIFAAQSLFRSQIQEQISVALPQPDFSDYLVTVTGPTLVQLKKNHLVQLCRAFMQTCGLTVEEAQTEALYLAHSIGFWELPRAADDAISLYTHELIQIQKHSHDACSLSAIFLDGFSAGYDEQGYSHSAKLAQVLQDLQHHIKPGKQLHYDNNQHWNKHPVVDFLLPLDHTHLDLPSILHCNGWTVRESNCNTTCWVAASPFSSGKFVNWEYPIVPDLPNQLESVYDVLAAYESAANNAWDTLITKTVAEITSILQYPGMARSSTLHQPSQPSVMSQYIPSMLLSHTEVPDSQDSPMALLGSYSPITHDNLDKPDAALKSLRLGQWSSPYVQKIKDPASNQKGKQREMDNIHPDGPIAQPFPLSQQKESETESNSDDLEVDDIAYWYKSGGLLQGRPAALHAGPVGTSTPVASQPQPVVERVSTTRAMVPGLSSPQPQVNVQTWEDAVAAESPSSEDRETEDEGFALETGIMATGWQYGDYDSDDPDYIAQPHATGHTKLITTPPAPATLLQRKRAQTKTSPLQHRHKRANMGAVESVDIDS
ncbi:hypothetical protein RhiTH_008940 [Rhizoctonia solani]